MTGCGSLEAKQPIAGEVVRTPHMPSTRQQRSGHGRAKVPACCLAYTLPVHDHATGLAPLIFRAAGRIRVRDGYAAAHESGHVCRLTVDTAGCIDIRVHSAVAHRRVQRATVRRCRAASGRREGFPTVAPGLACRIAPGLACRITPGLRAHVLAIRGGVRRAIAARDFCVARRAAGHEQSERDKEPKIAS